MRIAIIGSKKFRDYNLLKSVLNEESDITMIISGAAKGTDTLAKKYAFENNIKFIEFPPDFKKNGAGAKHIRDRLIVEHCDKIIAFWDKNCEGTKYTIDYGKKLLKPIRLINI